MIYKIPRHLSRRILFVVVSGIFSFLIAYVIDQYYIEGNGWWFLLELVQ